MNLLTIKMKFKMKITCLVFTLLILQGTPVIAAQNGDEYKSFLGFTLNKVILSDIQKKIGNSKLIEKGDAGEYEASICYVVPSGYKISFLSGELGGRDHLLLGYSVRKQDTETDHDCYQLNTENAREFKPQVGKLRISMTKKEFTRAFGEKIKWSKDTGMVSYESRRRMTEQEIQELSKKWPAIKEYPYYDTIISLTATFKGNILCEFFIWKTETN